MAIILTLKCYFSIIINLKMANKQQETIFSFLNKFAAKQGIFI